LPAGFQHLAEVRIAAGSEGVMITSRGSARFVIPRSESTIAKRRAAPDACSIAAYGSRPFRSGSDSTAASSRRVSLWVDGGGVELGAVRGEQLGE